jgi:hypothetical protein
MAVRASSRRVSIRGINVVFAEKEGFLTCRTYRDSLAQLDISPAGLVA